MMHMPQAFVQIIIVGNVKSFAELKNINPVGGNDGGVDTVQRRSAG